VEDAAVNVVLLFLRCVDADPRLESLLLSVALRRGYADPLDAVRAETFDVEGLAAVEPEARGRVAFEELQRQHAHADQVRAVNALVALRDDGLDAEQRRALRGPVARRACTILLAGQDQQRRTVTLITHRRFVDAGLLAARQVYRPAALGTGRELV